MNRAPTIRTQARPAPFEEDELLQRRKAAFQAAIRHSARVYFLRRGLPILAGASVVLVGLWLWIDPLKYVRGLPVEVGALKISGTKLTMEAPKLTGFSKDGFPYTVTAESAAQDLTKTNVIELNNIVGKFTVQDRGETVMNAKSGVYDSKEEKMHLTGGIDVRSAQGYAGKLIDADAEPKKGHLVSENPVEVTFNEGKLTSDRIEILDHGRVVVFENNVVLNLYNVAVLKTPENGDSAPSTSSAPDENKPKKKKTADPGQ